MSDAHLGYGRAQSKELKRRRRRQHSREHQGPERMLIKRLVQFFEPLRRDPLAQQFLAALVSDRVNHQTAERRSRRAHQHRKSRNAFSMKEPRTNSQEPVLQFVKCSVFPAKIWIACGNTSITVCNDSTAPDGLPGRFSTRDVPHTPHSPRLNNANGVFFSPSRRILSDTPSSILPQTERVASGVTSRAEIPVPPVVTTRRALRARSTIAFWMAP